MKGMVIFIIILFISMPIGFAKEVSIPELFEVEKQVDSEAPAKEVYYYAGPKLIEVNDEYQHQDRLNTNIYSQINANAKNEEEILEKLNGLLTDKKILTEIVGVLISSKWVNSKEYQEFKSLVIKINPNLERNFNII